jgi:hypothetical protein
MSNHDGPIGAPVVDPDDQGREEGKEQAEAHHDAIADALQWPAPNCQESYASARWRAPPFHVQG